MGKFGRKIRRLSQGTIELGISSRWKEDLLSIRHLLRALGFPETTLFLGHSKKPGHFVPGLVISPNGESSHTFTIGDVPGDIARASADWQTFFDNFPRSEDGKTFEAEAFKEVFYGSLAVDPGTAEIIVAELERAGISVPALAAHEARS